MVCMTPRWREMDSNHRSLCPCREGAGLYEPSQIWPRWCRLGSWVVSRTRTSDDLAPLAHAGAPGMEVAQVTPRKWPQVAASLAKTRKGKQGLNFIVGQSKIKYVKAVAHVSDICCTGE